MALILKIGADFGDAIKEAKVLEGTINGLIGSLSGLNKNINLSINPQLDAERVRQQIQQIKDSVSEISGRIDLDSADVEKVISSIQSKLSNLDTLTVDITANRSQIDSLIADITGDLSGLRGEIVINSPGLNDTLSKIQILEKELADLQTLVVDPNISSAQLTLFNQNIERVKNEIATLKGSIELKADVSQIDAAIVSTKEKIEGLNPEISPRISIGDQIADLKSQLATITSSTRIGVDTVEFDAALKEVQSKIAALDAPDIDLTADSSQFESRIKDIKISLSNLKDLSVKINADSNPAIKSINQLERELDELRDKINSSTDVTEIRKLGDEFNRVESRLSNTKIAFNLDKIGASGKRAADGLKSIPRSSSAATTSLINLGRVVQDAPFGIIGIANNINPLLESFQRLRAESTSTGNALESFGAALIGGGGIGLGVSVITSLLTQFALSSRSAATENDRWSKSIQENADNVRKKQDDFRASLDKVSSSLVNQSDKLKDLGAILVNTSGKVDGITQSTINMGLAQLIFDKKNLAVQKLITAQIERQLFDQTLKAGITASVPEFDSRMIGAGKFDKGVLLAEQQLKMANALGTGLEDLFKKILLGGNNVTNAIDDINDKIIARAKAFVKQFGEIFEVPDLEESFTNTKDKVEKAAKKLIDDVSKLNLKIKVPVSVDFDVTQVPFNPDEFKLSEDKLKELTKNFFDGIKLEKPEEPFVFDPSIQLAINKEKIDAEAAKKAEQLAESIKGIFAQAFQSLGEDIGNAFTGGGNLFESVFQIIGSGVAALGKQIIALGVAALNLKKALATLLANPALAIAAGVALTAIGTAMKNISGGGVKGFAEGGLVFGPTLGLVGEGFGTNRSNPEVIAPLDQLKSFLGNAGGQQVVIVNSRLRGRDMVLQTNRENRSQRR